MEYLNSTPASDFVFAVADRTPALGEAIEHWQALMDAADDAVDSANDAAAKETNATPHHLQKVREAGATGGKVPTAPDMLALASDRAYAEGAANTAIRAARQAAKTVDAVAEEHAGEAYTLLAKQVKERAAAATAAAVAWQAARADAFDTLALMIEAGALATEGRRIGHDGSQDMADIWAAIMPPLRPVIDARSVSAAANELTSATAIPDDIHAAVAKLRESARLARDERRAITHAEDVAVRFGKLRGF